MGTERLGCFQKVLKFRFRDPIALKCRQRQQEGSGSCGLRAAHLPFFLDRHLSVSGSQCVLPQEDDHVLQGSSY